MLSEIVNIDDILGNSLEHLENNYEADRDDIEIIIKNQSIFVKDLSIENLKKHIENHEQELVNIEPLEKDIFMVIQTFEVRLRLKTLILELAFKEKLKEEIDQKRIEGMQTILNRLTSLTNKPE